MNKDKNNKEQKWLLTLITTYKHADPYKELREQY